MRGIGWAVLYRDPQTGRLINMWINEHDVAHLAGGSPILIMDVFEHAYMPQYGLDRAKYIEAFFENIDWDIAAQRFMAAGSR
jgi:Fe-Mn family superoxide dismutase